MVTPTMAPMVGRELDLAVALEQLKRIERPAAASVLIRGDAGIGKSRLVADLAARARQLGHSVLVGRADDLDHGIPYAVFRDVLARPIVEDETPPELGGLMDGFRRAVERDAAPAATDGSDTDHVSVVFGALVSVLRTVASAGPLLLILEDLHVADRASLALVGPLARLTDLPMLTVVTMRPGSAADDVERFLERMAGDGRGSVIELEPLDRHETQALVSAVLGAIADEAVSEAVFKVSNGNPFFATEAAQSFLDAGAIVIETNKARLVRDAPALALRPNTALLRRLFSGTSADVELAKVMSVFGRFSLGQLAVVARLTGQPEREVANSFDRLVKSGLLVESEGGYEFSHAIVRSTLYDDIGPAERRRIHAAIAAQLGQDRRDGILLDVLELATHVSASAETGDEDAARVLLDAGKAVAVTAPLVSADYHRRASELLPADHPLRLEALALTVRALHAGSRPGESATAGLQVLDELPHGPEHDATASLVVNDLFLAGRVDDALAVLDPTSVAGEELSAALALEVWLLFQAGRYEDASIRFDAALAALHGPPAVQLLAIANLVQYANHIGATGISNDLLARAEDLANRASPSVQHSIHALVAFADWRPGMVARLESHLETARALRPDSMVVSVGGGLELAQLRLDWMLGRWDHALALASSVGYDLAERGLVVVAGLFDCLAADIGIDRGNLDDAAAIADRFADDVVALRRNNAWVRARLARATGNTATAETLLQAERAVALEGSVWKLAEILRELVEIFLETDRRDEAVAAIDELEQLSERTGWLECSVAALAARATLDRDVDVAREYLNLAEAERWEVQRAHAALLLGELDDEPATNLALAYRLYDGFGAAPARRRAAAGLRARSLTVPRRTTREGASLTDTEVQLVRLVYEGLSNAQIATAMHYSRKTIEVYLSRVYVKTGCSSRLELIRAVERGDLEVS